MGKNKNQKYDAILVLGVSTKKDLFKNRVEKAVKLYEEGITQKIIFSGRCWGGLRKKPRTTEARLMSKYAIKQGTSKKDILLEERSLNTAGNFYFTKKQIFKPMRIKKILIITQPDHFKKAQYLAKKILGKEYKLTWMSDGTTTKSKLSGHTALEEIKHFFDNIKDGDDKEVAKLLRAHPHYRRYRGI